MSRYRAYSELKDSGVEWLGQIPKSWIARQLKYLCTYNDEVLAETTNNDYEIEYVDIGSVSAITGINNIERISFDLAPSRARRVVRDGDIIISTVRTYLEAIASIVNPSKNLIVSTGFAVIRPNQYLHKGYAAYCLRAPGFIKEVIARSVGVSYPAINASDLVNIKVLEPPYNEQTQIANFLDHETAKIDTLIEKQQQLIKLLKEKRQAVISHAVIKGLNSDVPMKDSGVKWLGEVPEKWQIKRVKHFGKVIGGYAFKSEIFSSTGARVIKIANVAHLAFDWTDSSFLPETCLEEQKEYILPKGFLVFAMTRPIISGGVKVAKFELNESCLVNQRVGFIKPSQKINQDYLMYVAQSKSFFCAFENNTTATNQPNISSEGIEDISFACPCLKEQAKIVDYLENLLNLIEVTINKANSQINLMQERRTALISAAVTGKIDVRHWQPTSSSSSHETAA